MSKVETQFLHCTITDKVAHLVFERPPLNLLSIDVFADLSDMFDQLNLLVNSDDVRVVVFSSGVEKAFSAGDDVKDGPRTSDAAIVQNDIALATLKKLSMFPVPIIAAFNGYVMGGGLTLGLVSDYVVAADSSRYAYSEIDYGMFPNWGTTAMLAKRFPLPLMKKLLYTGERFDAAMAKELDMVQEVVTAEELLPRAMEIARSIAVKAPIGIRSLKALMNSSYNGLSEEGHYHLESSYTRLTFDSDDCAEGVKAFAEKRDPVFRNR